jgi:predicted PurR-regulated permease PerM
MTQNSKDSSPRWQVSTKILVALFGFVLLAAFLDRFRSILGTLVVSIIVYFLITPVVRILVRRARLSWVAATNISFLFLLMVMVVVFTALGLAVAQQFQSLFDVTQTFFTELPDRLETIFEQGVQVESWALDFSRFDTVTLFEQAAGYIDLVFSSASTVVLNVSSVALETVVGSIVVMVISYFLTLDNERFRNAWTNFVIPGYEYDIKRLSSALSRLWSSFLGGQLLVVTVTGLLTWLIMSALGMRFSLGIGVLGGLGRFVPIVGPWAAGIVAGVVALVQPSNWFGLTPAAHAALVILLIVVLNQSIDYFVIPRIIGTSLNISPAIVLIATLLGAILAGVLGLLLAAPIVASLALLGRYIFRKMVDQSPWDPPIDEVPEVRKPALARLFGRDRRRSAGDETNDD